MHSSGIVRRLGGLLAVLAAASLLLVELAGATSASGRAKTVVVTISGSGVKTSPSTVPAGTVTFRVANNDTSAHRFSVGGHTTSTIAPGKTTTLTVTLDKAGATTYHVLLAGPRTGTLTVTGGSSSSGGAGDVALGKKVFTGSGCGKCHILAAANSKGTIGPNLDTVKPSLAKVVSQVTSGGGFMPSFGGKLSKAQIAAVAAFVYKSTH